MFIELLLFTAGLLELVYGYGISFWENKRGVGFFPYAFFRLELDTSKLHTDFLYVIVLAAAVSKYFVHTNV